MQTFQQVGCDLSPLVLPPAGSRTRLPPHLSKLSLNRREAQGSWADSAGQRSKREKAWG